MDSDMLSSVNLLVFHVSTVYPPLMLFYPSFSLRDFVLRLGFSLNKLFSLHEVMEVLYANHLVYLIPEALKLTRF